MASEKELKEQRAPMGVRIRQLADTINTEHRDFSTAERNEWERLNADFDLLSRQIDQARGEDGRSHEPYERRVEVRTSAGYDRPTERAADVGRELSRREPNPPGSEDTIPGGRSGKVSTEEREEARAVAFQAWCRKQSGLPLTKEQVRACKRAGLNPSSRGLNIDLPRRPGSEEKRSLSATLGSAGGYTVPTSFMRTLEAALKDYNGVRQVADVIRTDDGTEMPWPTVNDTANKGRRIGESAPIQQSDPPFGRALFNAYKYTSDLVLIPSELLDDSAFALAEEMGPMLGERIGRAQEDDFTNGSGAAMPVGIVAAAAAGKTAANSTTLTGDDVIDLIHSVDPAYRRDPSFRLMFHDQVLAVIRKLKDSTGRYLFEEGQNGAPSKIKGVEYVINMNMPSAIASGVRSMVAGAFKKYKVRDVKRVRFLRLDERYADNDQVGFVAFMRSDGKILNAGTGPIKALVHP
ncbi:MAG TPA: phage major capsid protein [Urbifossiella sp.]|jgi:HK97 family phage major capsid protein|nr:phage major capsid protein [Urbifossiella sp.]